MKFIFFLWNVIKTICRIIFWLIIFVLFIGMLIWFVGKVHPIFDIGLEDYLKKFLEFLKQI